MMNRILIISGPTGIGKTGLGLKLASNLKTEIISADSRQIYKYMDIVTGKDLPFKAKFTRHTKLEKKINKYSDKPLCIGNYNFNGTAVWGLDLVEPDKILSAAHFYVTAKHIIDYLWQQNKLPIIVGGTGFWISSLIKKIPSLGVAPDKSLREKFKNCSLSSLQTRLKKEDRKKYLRMNRSDKHNPRRLIRAIEIAVGKNDFELNQPLKLDSFFQAGLKIKDKPLKEKINKRVRQRVKDGALEEVKKLLKMGYSWDLASMSAIGYKQLKSYFTNEVSLKKALENWFLQELSYAKAQMLFLK